MKKVADVLRPRRAFLYMPGDNERFLTKAAGLNVDVVCMDCEDAVAPDNKPLARRTITKMLSDLDFGNSERVVRINSVSSGLMPDDVAGILTGPVLPDTIVIPKVQNVGELAHLQECIASAIERRGQSETPASLRLIMMIESGQGLMNMKEVGVSLGLIGLAVARTLGTWRCLLIRPCCSRRSVRSAPRAMPSRTNHWAAGR
jgi:citrate lyase subunit beta-like protein